MRQFNGIIPPMVTPLTDQDRLDEPGLARLIEHILDGGVKGLFLLGSSGEATSLPESLRKVFVEKAIRQVAGRVPVLVGITDTCLSECLARAAHAADQGADAVVLSAPYYFPIGQDELLSFSEKIVNASPLPVLLYNIPGCTKVSYEVETIKKLCQHPGIKGVKDSSGDMQYLHKLIDLARVRPDWSILVGSEELLAEAVIMGAHGGICGGANMFPRLYQTLYEAAKQEDMDQVKELHRLVMKLSKNIYNGNYLPGVKHALECMHICSGHMAEPLHRPNMQRQSEIADFLVGFEDYRRNQPDAHNLRRIVAW